jgi:DNA-binding transcriptional regulator YhcF (GntR family)
MDKQKVLSVIYKYKNNNICPSVKQLMEHTGMKKNSLHNIKKEFEDSGILKTTGRKTVLLCDYNDALEKIWA